MKLPTGWYKATKQLNIWVVNSGPYKGQRIDFNDIKKILFNRENPELGEIEV